MRSLVVQNSVFQQNYGSQSSSALLVKNVFKQFVTLSDLHIINNTAAFSFFEEEHMLPFYDILSQRFFKLNFLQVGDLPACRDEISQISSSNCSLAKVEFENLTAAFVPEEGSIEVIKNRFENKVVFSEYPAMQGAV
jgi:hypothetical protein